MKKKITKIKSSESSEDLATQEKTNPVSNDQNEQYQKIQQGEPIAEGNVEPRRQQVLPVTDGKVERTISPAVIKDGTSTRRNKSKLARTLGRRRRRSAK